MQSTGVILDFVRVLSSRPEKVAVTQVGNSPIVLEIRVCKDDLDDIKSKEHAIRTICSPSHEEQLTLEFVGVDCT